MSTISNPLNVSHGLQIEVNLDAIAANYHILKHYSSSATVIPVVKANAYGLGVEQVVSRLILEGAQSFFVARLDEALALRALFSDITIYILHGVFESEVAFLHQYHLIPVVNSYSQWCAIKDEALEVVLHVDTAMNRLGLMPEDYLRIVNERYNATADIVMLMSHLAAADDISSPLTLRQKKLFDQDTSLMSDVPRSLANSHGVFWQKEFHYDFVRPGSALYGIQPGSVESMPMHHVVSVTAPIIDIRVIDRFQGVGYGATESLAHGSRVAVLPVGYADGFLRQLSCRGHAVVRDYKVPYIGRVSMDLITLDITCAKEVLIGDQVTLIGSDITVDEVAQDAGTIGYEILTQLSQGACRRYVTNSR